MAVERYLKAKGTPEEAWVYLATYFDPEGTRRKEIVREVRVTDSEKKHQDARDLAKGRSAQRRREVKNGDWKPTETQRAKERVTFKALVADFLKSYRSERGSNKLYVERSKAWLEFFKEMPVDAIRSKDVEKFRNHRMKAKTRYGKPIKPSTVRCDLVTLCTMFAWAERNGYIERNPAEWRAVKRPKVPRSTAHALTESDVDKLCANAEPWVVRAIRLMCATGLDLSEACELSRVEPPEGKRWFWVNVAEGGIDSPRYKTTVERWIPLYPELSELLDDCGKVRNITKGDRVLLDDAGQPIHAERLRTYLKRLYKRAGVVPTAGPSKVFRHVFATRLDLRDASNGQRRLMMGHRTLDMTSRYTHTTRAACADRMGKPHGQRDGQSVVSSAGTE